MKKITLKENGKEIAQVPYSQENLLMLHTNFKMERIRNERYNVLGVRK